MTEQRVRRSEVIAPEPAEALANLIGVPVPGEVLPPVWHWVYLLERRSTADLGPDGHPAFGVPAPPGPGMKRMFAGGRVTTHRRLRIGEIATRETWVAATAEKTGRSGPLTFVTMRTEISQSGALAVTEEADLVYRPAGGGAPPVEAVGEPLPEDGEQLAVDEALLFRFSALTYNAHRIHYDLAWARHEGYAGLVVHGPLQALLMAGLLDRFTGGIGARTYAYRLVAPMVGPQTLTVAAEAQGARVLDARGRTTARSEIVT